ncbi:hypothetical protein LCGC14_0146900 [marine sediment metagenome]|uniref:Uncharacterized protein n=1 Tax=marine sediment metagenome TaxID=412755 RepID=A0A0F9Y1K2_9ZZZZ
MVTLSRRIYRVTNLTDQPRTINGIPKIVRTGVSVGPFVLRPGFFVDVEDSILTPGLRRHQKNKVVSFFRMISVEYDRPTTNKTVRRAATTPPPAPAPLKEEVVEEPVVQEEPVEEEESVVEEEVTEDSEEVVEEEEISSISLNDITDLNREELLQLCEEFDIKTRSDIKTKTLRKKVKAYLSENTQTDE